MNVYLVVTGPFHSTLVGDEAFPLNTWLLKPLPHRIMSQEHIIFYYRLSRARRVVENDFGLLAARYIYIYRYTDTYIHAHIHIHKYTYIRTNLHIHIHTHIHINIYIYIPQIKIYKMIQ